MKVFAKHMRTKVFHKNCGGGYSKTIFFKKNNVVIYLFDKQGYCVSKEKIKKEEMFFR